MAEYENAASVTGKPLGDFPTGPRKDSIPYPEGAGPMAPTGPMSPSLHTEIRDRLQADRLNAERIRANRDPLGSQDCAQACEPAKEFNPTGSDLLRNHIHGQRHLTRKLAEHAEQVSLACYELDHLLEIMPNLNPNSPAGRGWKRLVESYRRHEIFNG